MIDTIKFLIPIHDRGIIEKIKGTLMRFRKENLRDGKIEFEFFTANIELGSYHRTIAIKSTDSPEGFFVEFSVPKYEKGNNVEMIYPCDLMQIMEKAYKEICNHVNYSLPHFSTWPIYRLDICYNWLFKNSDEAISAINFIKRIDYPRKKKCVWDTSAMYKGTAYTVKFYLKGPEFKKHDFKKIETSKAVSLQAWANRIVRFEVNFKRAYLEEFLRLINVYARDISDNSIIQDMLIFYLKKVFFYINKKTSTEAEIEKILFDNFNKAKATRLYQFHKDYYFDETIKSMFLRGGLNRSTIYRYKKDLQRVGIGFSFDQLSSEKSILEQLVIPSENSKFDLFDYSFNEV